MYSYIRNIDEIRYEKKKDDQDRLDNMGAVFVRGLSWQVN